ncbi:zinc-binding metallopeptidase family protein [Cytophaga aurantiaca]|uniref:zinc-binding metallopeptidase family protein n=1 Tax=Cytophaga aurantiaca TaxID=29530 RepID=UPI000368D638|nr:putative zinc-binding peptidase [Cytophaga aurantiaca]
MKLFICKNCNNTLYFENSVCLSCQNPIGFDSTQLSMLTLQKNKSDAFYTDIHTKKTYKYCQNAQEATCNWLIPSTHTPAFCVACELNRTIPPLATAQNRERWHKIEIAKHRLVYSLLKLQLPIKKKIGNGIEGIAFDFTADNHAKSVMTGHQSGLITINIKEADEAERAKHKYDLNEKYRTLLGHFRHEIGHYYWDVLIKNNPKQLKKFRELFGNEMVSYEQSLRAYYSNPNKNTSNHYISIYATSHPWEDWAESWAHYMHLMDTIETAFNFGIQLDTDSLQGRNITAPKISNPYEIKKFVDIFNMWVPLGFAVNALSRSMGHPEFYPFVISEEIIEKLSFIHKICKKHRMVDESTDGTLTDKEKATIAADQIQKAAEEAIQAPQKQIQSQTQGGTQANESKTPGILSSLFGKK